MLYVCRLLREQPLSELRMEKDLTGDVFQVREDWTILQLLDEYQPDRRIRQYNYMESSLLVPGSQQPFILRLTCHKVRQGFILP